MKNRNMIIMFLLATILFCGLGGCTESEVQPAVDECARQAILQNFEYIRQNRGAIHDLQSRGQTNHRESQGLEIRPVPVPVIPSSPSISPRLPSTRINKSKKYTLLYL